MPRPVEGFMADDGTFFNSVIEAETYEATKAISASSYTLCTLLGVDWDRVEEASKTIMDWVVMRFDTIERYRTCNPTIHFPALWEPPSVPPPDPVEPNEPEPEPPELSEPDLFRGTPGEPDYIPF